ncbi:hypothetical protein NKI86_24155 [Mesorhizobium sp. M0320]|uniref:hypothetical protein n=1 Tax=unclassified Mesorhizobium TaxID=325217 RepID=UPI00333CB51C
MADNTPSTNSPTAATDELQDGVYELRVLVDKRGEKYTTHRVETQLQEDMSVEDDVIVRVDSDGKRRPISLG